MKLPESWTFSRLGDLILGLDAGVSVNSTDRPATAGAKGILKTSCVTTGIFDPNENKTIVEADLDRAYVNPESDSIILSRMNTPALVGASAYVSGHYPNLFLPDRLWLLKARSAAVSMRWLAYVLSSSATRYRISNLATGTSSSMKNITKEAILSLELPTPPIPEQKKIAEILSTWDRNSETLHRLICTVDAHLKGIISSSLARLPKGKRCVVSDFFEVVSLRAKNMADSLPLLSVTQDQGVVERSKLERRVVNPEGSTENYKVVHPGDFILSLRSFQGGLEYSRLTGLVSPAYTILRPKLDVDANFYRHYFKSHAFLQLLKPAIIGIRDGKQIEMATLFDLEIPFPTRRQQTQWAGYWTVHEQRLKQLIDLSRAFSKQKQGLMQQLLTGRVRVKV